ncbi:MAG: Tryptophan synthase alpha chain [Labilithrix sp.]|nr:Tryptophan synthase alpha chain [Labilithrix sp.]
MRTTNVLGLCVLVTGTLGTIAAVGACGSSSDRSFYEDDPDGAASSGTSGSGGFGSSGEAAPPCVGLQCQQKACGGGGDTTVTGKAYAPNGTLPLYNVIVYVPNTTPAAVTHGATCETCGSVTGSPVTTALSQPDGTFELKNVPVGKDIPLVIQVGKWRRQVTIPNVAECTETKLTDSELTRLPRNQSEGDMPRIALTTGGCDVLGCMLPKIGIDASEFGVQSDGPSKSVHTFVGSGGGAPTGSLPAQSFWNDVDQLKQYDQVILSCECQEAQFNKSGAFPAMADYLNAGGRIFTTDFMYTWYKFAPDNGLSSAVTLPGGAPLTSNPMLVDTSFPKGKALGDWLATVTPGSNNRVTPSVLFANATSLDPGKAQQWATSGSSAGPRAFTVNVPVGVSADKQCGKGVHIDAHLNDGAQDKVTANFPVGCTNTLNEGEKLLAFFLFDLASCIQDETSVPQPPPVK